MLARGDSVPLLFGSHEPSAPVIASRVSLHADNYGLGFSAMMDVRGYDNPNWGRLRAMVSRYGASDQCSVLLRIERKRPGAISWSDLPSQIVTRASIDHITITASAAYGDMTGVWRGDCDLFAAPNRLQNLAALWADGRAAWNARPKVVAAKVPQIAAASRSPHRPINMKVAAMLRPRLAHYAAVRAAFAAKMRAGELKGGVIFAHAAFTPEGGFDGDWSCMGKMPSSSACAWSKPSGASR